MKRKRVLWFAVAAAAGICVASGQGQEPKKDPNPIMRKKLEHAQKVLEGIAVKDFDLIGKHADELIILSKKAEWQILKTPDYVMQSDEFRRNAATLVNTAKEKNLDGAALAYVQMTMNCVTCHKYVREVRMSWLEKEKPVAEAVFFAARP